MISMKSLLEEVLFEKKEKGLKLFFDINVFIQSFEKEKEKENEVKPSQSSGEQTKPQQTQPVEQPVQQPSIQAQESKKFKKNNILNEEIYKQKTNGQIFVPMEKLQNIQSLEDLLDFLSDQKVSTEIEGKIKTKGKKVLDDFVIELIKALIEGSLEDIKELVSKGDKILINIDYGNSLEDLIGINLNKNSGSDTITLTMKKNNKIIPGQFNESLFNRELLNFRNEIVD